MTSTDCVVEILNSNDLNKKGTCLIGHKDLIRSIDMSHDGSLLLSCGNDRTCKLWSLRKPNELLYDIGSLNAFKSASSSSLKQTSSSNECKFEFKKEIVAANFFYMDKFILIGNQNKFHLCKYSIDSNKNDVQRYLNKSVFKQVKEMELNAAQSLTCLSTINTFYSCKNPEHTNHLILRFFYFIYENQLDLVITGATDKSIEVFDMNQAKSSLLIRDAHSRLFHQIAQNGSEHNRHSYDLFLTNSVGDGIKLWDLRVAQ